LAAVLVLTVTQTVGAAQHVKYQGTGSLMPTWGADLDTGVFNDPSPGSMSNDDLYFYVQGTHRYLDGFQSWGFGRMASRPSYQTTVRRAQTAATLAEWGRGVVAFSGMIPPEEPFHGARP
jgi:hypothetical protein